MFWIRVTHSIITRLSTCSNRDGNEAVQKAEPKPDWEVCVRNLGEVSMPLCDVTKGSTSVQEKWSKHRRKGQNLSYFWLIIQAPNVDSTNTN